jgi:GDP-L-fucose synthase
LSDSRHKTIFVAGHRGMVGSAVVRHLQALGYEKILTTTHAETDLTRQEQVEAYFGRQRIDQVYLAAAKVGGIHANDTYPAQFIYDNLMIECNVIHSAHRAGVQKLLLLGSSCIYPKAVAQPMREDALLTGVLEPTNEPYAIAKIAGIKLCESYNREYGRDYRSVMPTNLYGPNDNFHPENSHVIPALMRRFHEAVAGGQEKVVIWGSGTPKREFLHVDDMAAACLFLLENYDGPEQVNVGTGRDATIREIAALVAEAVGFEGQTEWDSSKPDGTPQKLLDVSKLRDIGWEAGIGLREGLASTVEWYRQQEGRLREAG